MVLLAELPPGLCPSCLSQTGLWLTARCLLYALFRRALRDALRRLLSLFGEMLQAALTLKSRIGERVGLCLEDEGLPDVRPGGQALFAGECQDSPEPAAPGPGHWVPSSFPTGAELDELLKLEMGHCLWDVLVLRQHWSCELACHVVYVGVCVCSLCSTSA